MAKNAPRQKRGNNDWTVTVYMAADNSLAEESVWALTEMQDTEPAEGVRIEVLFDSNAAGMPTKIYSFPTATSTATVTGNGRLLTSGRNFSIPIRSSATPHSGRQAPSQSNSRGRRLENASDRRLLQAFLTKTLSEKEHINTRQLLVLSGHGSGAIGDFLSGTSVEEPISIAGLGDTLEKVIKALKGKKPGFKFDIIGMDSCLMSMAEVAYELRDFAHILIGSEGFEPETGWPYKEIIPEIISAVGHAELAHKIVDKYISYYADYAVAGTSVDLSACDLTKSVDLANSLLSLSNKLLDAFGAKGQKVKQMVVDAVLLAHWRAQSYKNEQYVDLCDFCDLLYKGCKPNKGYNEVNAVMEACQKVCRVIGKPGSNDGFVIASKYFGAAFQHSHGVSIYFPWKQSSALDEYQNLSFAKKTRWGRFLKTYVKETQRKMRGESGRGTEEINIVPAERPLVIPLQDGVPAGAQTPSIAGRFPPDTGKGMLLGRDVMKNPPTSFLINKDSGEAVTDEDA